MPFQTAVLASGNKGKLDEFKRLLASIEFELRPQSHYRIDAIPETGASFLENALLKARHASRLTSLPALADDSGLVVPSLNGAPGIYSARYAGTPANAEKNNLKLLEALGNSDTRRAYFFCALVFLLHSEDPTPIVAFGEWHGDIAEEVKGNNGFGYDPLFVAKGFHITAAQMEPELKNR
ncbi:MAG: RdgB/HAM1 family non-canonical purine NTP pyrophosphatase, partial [Pseudomonadota bacterium]|nr:RdgB/HAM1 family non-canonical purine NTP pyrophosphatase [Pseudomonadota bacterium]